MTENVENLVLEHLRHIRDRVDKLPHDMDSLKDRLSSLEKNLAGNKRDQAGIYEDQARQQHEFDQLVRRVALIERRLELRND